MIPIGRLTFLACSLLPLIAAGCGGQGNTVSGQVTYDGKPLTRGMVTFTDASNKTASGSISTDGTYKVEKAPTGPVKIAIQAGAVASSSAPAKDDPMAGMKAAGGTPIPKRYGDPNESGLTYTVTSGVQTHNITLTP